MSSTSPVASRSTPSLRSTSAAKALAHPTLSPRYDIPPTSGILQSPGMGSEPSRAKPTSPNFQTKQSTPKPRHHIPHHPHRPHRHREPLKTVQAALLPSTTFGELLSPVKSTVGGFAARANSRKERQERDEGGLDLALKRGEAKATKEPTWADVTRQEDRRIAGETKLRKQLTSLSNLATSTTRQLDYTYYSLLSSLPSIAKSLSSLSDLAAQSQTLLDEFTGSSIPSLTADISAQIASLQGNFDKLQSERISGLESRMRAARERVTGLGERVEGVKTRVEEWEQREKDGKRRGRRRVSILWGVLGSILGLFLIMAVFNGWQGELEELGGNGKLEASRRIDATFGDETVTKTTAGLLDDGRPPEDTKSSLARETSTQDEFDARLRVFDDL